MRFVWAVIAFVLAAALIGAGIAQRTVFLGPDEATMKVEISEPQPYTLVDAEVFRAHAGLQTLQVSGSDTIYLAYGRTSDMEAWLADAPFTHVTLDADGTAVAESVEAETPTYEGEFSGRNPAGADLWLDEYTSDTGTLNKKLQLPDGVSVLLASDGTAPAPSDVSIVWPISNATPWAGPLIVLGGILLLLGLILYFLGVRHVRRSRGPRRKGRMTPPTRPRALGAGRRKPALTAPEPQKEITAGEETDGETEAETGSPDPDTGRSPRGGRRALIALPAMGLTVALLTGCSPDAWPQLAETPTPSPTETVVAPEHQQAPALTEAQAARIAESIAATVAEADEKRDGDLAATRLEGVALEVRKVNYKVRSGSGDFAAPQPLPGGGVQILLPQAFDEWPRNAMMIVEGATPAEGEQQAPPAIMNITQADPWSNYKVTTFAYLEASVEIPKLAPAWLGSSLIPPDSSFLQIAPDQLAAAYADVLQNGDSSKYASMFDLESDAFRSALETSRAESLKILSDKGGAETAEMTFEQRAGAADPVALGTLENGALVAVTLDTTIVTKPKEEGVFIEFDSNPAARVLLGTDKNTTGVVETNTNQLFFAVPAKGSDEAIRVLGFAGGLVDGLRSIDAVK
ncbi:glycosyl transferase [Microbacterium stercoris]|uniref:Glycosyl transferase n=1 Tax=Microbacterium stercoris TaxID=2820289 RepID=A0A939TXU0_9MICO|nr:glycosyl transferase [Microbacterium stercoris]MBO3664007.1 glycosyl transferase [Microbacterium stercoris]